MILAFYSSLFPTTKNYIEDSVTQQDIDLVTKELIQELKELYFDDDELEEEL